MMVEVECDEGLEVIDGHLETDESVSGGGGARQKNEPPHEGVFASTMPHATGAVPSSSRAHFPQSPASPSLSPPRASSLGLEYAGKERTMHQRQRAERSTGEKRAVFEWEAEQERQREERRRVLDARPEMFVAGVDLSHLSPPLQLLVCVAGTFFFYLFNALVQERIFRFPGFSYGWYMTFVQFAITGTLALLQEGVKQLLIATPSSAVAVYSKEALVDLPLPANIRPRSSAPLYLLATVAFFLVSSMGFANEASGYVSYPTIMLFKCSKLVPVMLGGILVMKRSYGWFEYLSAALLSAGLVVLSVDFDDALSFHSTGTVLLCLALLSDAFVGNFQERAMTKFRCSDSEMMLYSYSMGAMLLALALVLSGKWGPSFDYCSQHATIYLFILMYSFSSFVGLLFILAMIRRFGAFVAMTVTSCRKAMSLFLSFLLFENDLNSRMAVAIPLIFAGVLAHIYAKNEKVIVRAWVRATERRRLAKTRTV